MRVAITIVVLVCMTGTQLVTAYGGGYNKGYGGGYGYGGYSKGYGGYGGYGKGYGTVQTKASYGIYNYLDPNLAYYIPYPVPLPPVKQDNNYYGGYNNNWNFWLLALLILPFLLYSNNG